MTMTTTDDQALWDHQTASEEALRFRRKIRGLFQVAFAAEERVNKAKGELSLARGELREARLKLQQALEADRRPCPLFERAGVNETNIPAGEDRHELPKAPPGVDPNGTFFGRDVVWPETTPHAIQAALADAAKEEKEERPLIERIDELGTSLEKLGLPANILAALHLAEFQTAEDVREYTHMDGRRLVDYLSDAVRGIGPEEARMVGWAIAEALDARGLRSCGLCGCTESNCEVCVDRTGSPCRWVGPLLCSACGDEVPGALGRHFQYAPPRPSRSRKQKGSPAVQADPPASTGPGSGDLFAEPLAQGPYTQEHTPAKKGRKR